jgi:Rod binding domain-containing protein
MAGDVLERISQDRKAREAYYQRRKWYLDKVSSEKYLLSKGREEGIAETVLRQLSKKLGEVPEEYVSKLMARDKQTLDRIADSIFDIESIKDLDKFLN